MNTLFEFTFLSYPLRTILASAALFSYYRIFLYNRNFHQVNRFFLLGSAVLALLLPLVPLSLHPGQSSADPGPLTTVFFPAANTTSAVTPSHSSPTFNWVPVALLAYCLITVIFFTRLSVSVYRIVRAARKYPAISIGPIRFLTTTEPGTPFSFLRWLFWNEQQDPQQEKGRLIFLHESYHIRQYHTLDILGLECIRCLCWFNPFIHLICREIRTVHEFLADHNAMQNSDRHTYAELLVWQAATQPSSSLQHPFFNSSIKRRITMIIQQRARRANPFGCIIALPVLMLLLSSATTSPGRNVHSSSPVQTSAAPADSSKLLRQYCKNLRYPIELTASHQGGSICFSIRVDGSGDLKDFIPLDASASGNKTLKIVVMAYPSKNASQPLSKEQVLQILLEEARRASGAIGQQLAQKPQSLSPGEYYLEVKFSLDSSNDKISHP